MLVVSSAARFCRLIPVCPLYGLLYHDDPKVTLPSMGLLLFARLGTGRCT